MASTVNVMSQADSVIRRASGTIVAGATASDVLIDIGFVPKRFVLMGIVNLLKQEWVEGMNKGDFFETTALGAVTLETDDQLWVGAVGDKTNTATNPPTPGEGQVLVQTGGGILDDNDGAVWFAEG